MIYASAGSEAFNAWLDQAVRRVADDAQAALGQNLVALVLGGGYGRGEGGVVVLDGQERPYNDLDFTVIVRRKQGVAAALAPVSRCGREAAGVEVDFSRPLTEDDVAHWPRWLMWQDLLNGHVVVKGPADILARLAPASLREPLPAIEATRLLLNRGAGLLWAMRVARGCEAAPDSDFVRRNYYKCALALGDAALIAWERYTTLCAGRDQRLAALEGEREEVRRLGAGEMYAAALRFKVSPGGADLPAPDDKALGAMAAAWGRVFLGVENRRTGKGHRTLDEYVAWRGLREPELHTPWRLARNAAQNAARRALSWRYGREDLYRQAPRLLGVAGPAAADWPAESARFLETWKRFN
ncbi:MAG TPA: hypothetical protein P5137_00010 [Candidatus Brocadiia bacterium]|nr:hypothetical protein [Candidatus Brocadiia bacterium]